MTRQLLFHSLAFAFILLTFVSSVSAFGVGSPYWKGNPLVVAPGEQTTVYLSLQNMVGDEDLTVRVAIKEGSEIAYVEARDYNVRAGTSDTRVPVEISVPGDVALGTPYVVTVSFATVNSGAGGGVAIGTAIDTSFDVITGDVVQMAPSTGSRTLTYVVIAVILLIAIVAYILYRRRAKN